LPFRCACSSFTSTEWPLILELIWCQLENVYKLMFFSKLFWRKYKLNLSSRFILIPPWRVSFLSLLSLIAYFNLYRRNSVLSATRSFKQKSGVPITFIIIDTGYNNGGKSSVW
jgi:hypothetical protein